MGGRLRCERAGRAPVRSTACGSKFRCPATPAQPCRDPGPWPLSQEVAGADAGVRHEHRALAGRPHQRQVSGAGPASLSDDGSGTSCAATPATRRAKAREERLRRELQQELAKAPAAAAEGRVVLFLGWRAEAASALLKKAGLGVVCGTGP